LIPSTGPGPIHRPTEAKVQARGALCGPSAHPVTSASAVRSGLAGIAGGLGRCGECWCATKHQFLITPMACNGNTVTFVKLNDYRHEVGKHVLSARPNRIRAPSRQPPGLDHEIALCRCRAVTRSACHGPRGNPWQADSRPGDSSPVVHHVRGSGHYRWGA